MGGIEKERYNIPHSLRENVRVRIGERGREKIPYSLSDSVRC